MDLGEVAEGHGRGKLPHGGALEGLEEGERGVLDCPSEAVGVGAVCQSEGLVHEVVVDAELFELRLGELVAGQPPRVAQGAKGAGPRGPRPCDAEGAARGAHPKAVDAMGFHEVGDALPDVVL
jgi:hypothetical protein